MSAHFCLYYVVPAARTGRWVVICRGHITALYDTQDQALQAARNAALRLYNLGLSAQVAVRGADGKFRTEQVYAKKALPPAG